MIFPNELICLSSITGSLDMCILNLKKKQLFKINFLFWKISGNIDKISISVFRLVIFQYLKSYLTKIFQWVHYGIIIKNSRVEKMKMDKSVRIGRLGTKIPKLMQCSEHPKTGITLPSNTF